MAGCVENSYCSTEEIVSSVDDSKKRLFAKPFLFHTTHPADIIFDLWINKRAKLDILENFVIESLERRLFI